MHFGWLVKLLIIFTLGSALVTQPFLSIVIYYINISEIPGKPSGKNMISSLVKITC